MEENGKFKMNFQLGVVKSGVKMSGSSLPQITATSTFNKFNINNPAQALMGVKEGSYLVFSDMITGADDMDSRFYIFEGWDTGKVNEAGEAIFTGAKIGVGANFNYSKIYGLILKQDWEALEVHPSDLIRDGLMEKSGKALVALKKVTADLEAVADGEPLVVGQDADGNDVMRVVYRLHNYEETAHTPRVQGDGFSPED